MVRFTETHHVSQSYSRADSILDLKIRSFIFFDSNEELQMLISQMFIKTVPIFECGFLPSCAVVLPK